MFYLKKCTMAPIWSVDNAEEHSTCLVSLFELTEPLEFLKWSLGYNNVKEDLPLILNNIHFNNNTLLFKCCTTQNHLNHTWGTWRGTPVHHRVTHPKDINETHRLSKVCWFTASWRLSPVTWFRASGSSELHLESAWSGGGPQLCSLDGISNTSFTLCKSGNFGQGPHALWAAWSSPVKWGCVCPSLMDWWGDVQ